jgi:hypothetical protein
LGEFRFTAMNIEQEETLHGTIVGVHVERRKDAPRALQPVSYDVRLDDGREASAILDLVKKNSYPAFSCRTFDVRFGQTRVGVVLGTVLEPIRIVSIESEWKF